MKKNKDSLTVWTVEEIVEDIGTQNLQKELYEKEEVEDFLSDIMSMIDDAIRDIDDIQGIDIIDTCKEKLKEISNMLY